MRVIIFYDNSSKYPIGRLRHGCRLVLLYAVITYIETYAVN